tara:strand:- start:119 stop:721 length:603 start_codon:yes stop_codon:yes gene_type:complete
MANIDAPFGFRQVGGLGSRPTSNGTSQYKIASGQTAAIYAGDVVCLAGSGDLKVEGGTTVTAGHVGPSETDATRNVGIFNGCLYDDPTTQKPTFQNYWPGDVAAAANAFVYDDPDDLFEVQTAGTHTQAVVGQACDMVYAAGAAVSNGRSKEELAGTAGANDMFTVLRLSEDPANSDVSTANSNWIVRFNVGKHVYLTGI